MSEEKQISRGVKIISILVYIMSGLAIIFGLFSFYELILFNQFYHSNNFVNTFSPLVATLNIHGIILKGILELILGVFGLFVARGLWKTKNWAKITTIIFSVLGIIFSQLNFIQNPYTSGPRLLNYYGLFDFLFSFSIFLIFGIICLYLSFNKNAKESFY